MNSPFDGAHRPRAVVRRLSRLGPKQIKKCSPTLLAGVRPAFTLPGPLRLKPSPPPREGIFEGATHARGAAPSTIKIGASYLLISPCDSQGGEALLSHLGQGGNFREVLDNGHHRSLLSGDSNSRWRRASRRGRGLKRR